MALTEQMIIDAYKRVKEGRPRALDKMIVSQRQMQSYRDYMVLDDVRDHCRFETTERRALE